MFNGLVWREQALGAEPDLQQVRPLIESSVPFTQSHTMRTTGKDMRLGGNSGLDERFVEAQPLYNRDHIIR